MNSLLAGLNPEQRCAVTYTGGPLKIVAGAGTGKTGTLTRRFAWLVREGMEPDRILALTFSRRAAMEFRRRTLELLDGSYKHLPISTFHGFCLRVLREEREYFGRFGVMGELERQRVVARAVRDDPDAGSRSYYLGEIGARRLVADALTLISRTKDENISPAHFAEYADRRGVERLRELSNVYLAYEALCERIHRFDFGDLSSRLAEEFEHDAALLARWQGRFDAVMVDEFQDTNESQWRLLTLLAPPPDGPLTVVGDACQAIYAFRGASPRYFDRFEEEYSAADTIVLSTNYRSRQRILDAAHALIGCTPGEITHRLEAHDRQEGEPVRMAGFADEDMEADYIARSILRLMTGDGVQPEECAILCRSARQSARPLARALTAYGIPFYVRGYDPEVDEALQDLAAVLRCIEGNASWTDAARVLVRRQVALTSRLGGDGADDPLAKRYAHLIGPNKDVLRDVPPLDSLTYARVTDWMDGSDSWRTLDEVRRSLPPHLSRATEALDRLTAACTWMRSLSLEGQVYASLALVGRLDPGRSDTAGPSACRKALRAAHGLQRAGLGIPALLADLAQLSDEESPLGSEETGGGVPIITLHASKGLEWPYVFMPGVAAGRLPAPFRHDRAFDLDDLAWYVQSGRGRSLAEVAATYDAEPERARAARHLAEERRLAYVGCTRARLRLTLTYARSYGGGEAEPSPFLAEIQTADRSTWTVDEQSDAGVMTPLDVARSTRQQALAALGVPRRPVIPSGGDEPGDVLGTVLAAEWTASHVRGGVPIRFRSLPQPFIEESGLRVSFSGLESYGTCPRQYFYGHVLHVDAPPRGTSVVMGSKMHTALARLNTLWMERGEPPDDAEVVAAWREVWPVDAATIEAAMRNPETRVRWEPGFLFARQVVQGWQRGLKQLRRYYLWEREMRSPGAQRVPVVVEHSFLFERGSHTFDGRIDCVLRTPDRDIVVDFKSGSSDGMKPEKSLQLAIYEAAWKRDSLADPGREVEVAYIQLATEDDKGERVKPAWDWSKQLKAHIFTDSSRDAVWATIDNHLQNITANHFAAEPQGDACTLCAYNTWCEGSQA